MAMAMAMVMQGQTRAQRRSTPSLQAGMREHRSHLGNEVGSPSAAAGAPTHDEQHRVRKAQQTSRWQAASRMHAQGHACDLSCSGLLAHFRPSLFYPYYDPWPTTLPETEFTPVEYKARYGYFCSHGGKGNDTSKIPDNVPIKRELEQLCLWSSTPIQLDRPSRSISSGTWQDIVDVISRYLGFARRWHQVTNDSLSLQLFTNQRLLAEFLGFVWQRSKNTVGFNNQVRDGAGAGAHPRHLARCLHAMEVIEAEERDHRLLSGPLFMA